MAALTVLIHKQQQGYAFLPYGSKKERYLSDSIVGIMVMALTILIPGMPNMIMYMQHSPPTPPGWSCNPSSWPQRWS